MLLRSVYSLWKKGDNNIQREKWLKKKTYGGGLELELWEKIHNFLKIWLPNPSLRKGLEQWQQLHDNKHVQHLHLAS